MSVISLSTSRVREILDEGGVLIDLRPTQAYLDRHVRGSIPLLFEDGPGLPGRARDLIPLDSRLVLLDDGDSPLDYAADMLRGKGFDVAGVLPDLKMWRGEELIATRALNPGEPVTGLRLLNVRDPGTVGYEDAFTIPAERLWSRAEELGKDEVLGVICGWCVRAAAAVGILERLGFRPPVLVRTRPAGATPPMAGPSSEMFRVSGETSSVG